MASVELHYSRVRLARLFALGAVMTGLFLWIGLEADDFADGSGRGARLTRAIGTDGLRIIGFGLAAVCLAFSALYLRLLVGADRLAARADSAGVTLRTLFSTRDFRWADVEVLFVRRVPTPAGEQWLVMLRPRTGRDRGIAANALVEREDELEAWVESTEKLRRAASDLEGSL